MPNGNRWCFSPFHGTFSPQGLKYEWKPNAHVPLTFPLNPIRNENSLRKRLKITVVLKLISKSSKRINDEVALVLVLSMASVWELHFVTLDGQAWGFQFAPFCSDPGWPSRSRYVWPRFSFPQNSTDNDPVTTFSLSLSTFCVMTGYNPSSFHMVPLVSGATLSSFQFRRPLAPENDPALSQLLLAPHSPMEQDSNFTYSRLECLSFAMLYASKEIRRLWAHLLPHFLRLLLIANTNQYFGIRFVLGNIEKRIILGYKDPIQSMYSNTDAQA